MKTEKEIRATIRDLMKDQRIFEEQGHWHKADKIYLSVKTLKWVLDDKNTKKNDLPKEITHPRTATIAATGSN